MPLRWEKHSINSSIKDVAVVVLYCAKRNENQVYDLHESNSWLQHVGLGMYHSGLEVGGVEYTFSEAGIGQHPPRQIAGDGVSYKTTEVGHVAWCGVVLTLKAPPLRPLNTAAACPFLHVPVIHNPFFFFSLGVLSLLCCDEEPLALFSR